MQLTLFPPARKGHATQLAAARAVAPFTPSQRDRVAAYVLSRGDDGSTNEEIATALDMRLSSVCGRVNELKRLGELVLAKNEYAEVMTRKGTSGIGALVWRHKSAPSPYATLEGTFTGFADGTMSINNITLQVDCPHPPFLASDIGYQVRVQTKSGRVTKIEWPLSTVAMGMKGSDASQLD